jgi:hypothetical protein
MLERVCREADIDEIASNENSISTAFSVEGNSGINEGRSWHRRAPNKNRWSVVFSVQGHSRPI